MSLIQKDLESDSAAVGDASEAPPASRSGSVTLAVYGLLGVVLFVAGAGAWLCQSALHLKVGQAPPTAGAYALWPGIGASVVSGLANSESLWLFYLLFAIVFAIAGLLAGRAFPWSPGLRAMHLEPEAPVPPVERRSTRRRAGAIAVAGFALAGCALCLVFTVASARADLFVVPDDLGGLDRRLLAFYRFFGLSERPVWWVPVLTYFLCPAFLGLAVAALGDAAGDSSPRRPLAPLCDPQRILEWSAVALICWASTAAYLRDCETAPWVIQQDEGIVAKFGYFLTRPESQGTAEANIFHDPVQPNLGFATRGIAIAFSGNSFEPLRYVSALTSGIGLIVVYLFLRGIVGGFAAVFTTALVATSHIVIQYSRIGINNIDSMYWMFVMAGLFYAAETARADTVRLLRYLACGFACGMSFGMYTGTQLGAAAVAGLAVLRVAGQIDLGWRRLAGIGLLGAGLVLGALPFKANPLAEYGRSELVYLLRAKQMAHEFEKPEIRSAGITTVDKLVGWHLRRSMLGYHGISDTSHDYTSPFPFVGPLLSVLSALGGLILLFRWRCWAAYFAWGLFIAGNLLGGALRHSPYPPSSARLILLMPAIALAAAVAVEAFVRALMALRGALGEQTRLRRLSGLAAPGVAAAFSLWALGSEVRTNVALYDRFLTSPYLTYHYWMGASTELQRAIADMKPKPGWIFQFDREVTANQSYWHNDFLLPHTEGQRHWIDSVTEFPAERMPSDGYVLFIFHNERLRDLAEIERRYPGGVKSRTTALPFPGAKPRYTLYRVFVGRTR